MGEGLRVRSVILNPLACARPQAVADSILRFIDMGSSQAPKTIIVRHPRERVQKCSVWPLRHRDDLIFLEYPVTTPLELSGYVRLAVDGPPLAEADAGHGLLVLDGSWRWAEVMTKAFAHVPPRSLSGWKTAYPRVSKMYQDPAAGLATVEALYIAYHILGRPTEGLLDEYRWAEEFLRANGLG
jgi:pre-rRNA-processing protein TSR3